MNISVNLKSHRLEWALKAAGIEDPATVSRLIVSGLLTDNDIMYIREKMGTTLRELDMSGASFVNNTIRWSAFEECIGLTSVIIPDSVTAIGHGAFSGCTGLTAFNFPASVICIDIHDRYCTLFSDCTALTDITVHPDNPEFASENGVLFNKNKTKLIEYPQARQGDYVIPDTTVEIGHGAFFNCTGLTSVIIPSSVSKIEGWAFRGCTKLTSVFIPSSVTEISRYNSKAFEDCIGILSFEVHPDNLKYSSKDGVLFNKCKTELIEYPAGRQGDYVIPKSVKTICGYAFSGCTGLTSVTIPNSVTFIGFIAFLGCIGLTSVFIPESVEEICDVAFLQCTGLSAIAVHPDNPFYESVNGKLKKKIRNDHISNPNARTPIRAGIESGRS